MKLFIGIAIFALGGCAAGATLLSGSEAAEAAWKEPALIVSALTSGLGFAITTLAWWQGRENYTKTDAERDQATVNQTITEAGNTVSREAWSTRNQIAARAEQTDDKIDALAAMVDNLGLSKDRVIELARTVRKDVEDFDEAKTELQYLVSVARDYLLGGGKGDNLDEFVRGVIDTAKGQSFHDGQSTINDALSRLDQQIETAQDQLEQQTQSRLVLLDEGIELDILARDAAAVAQKEWRKIQLESEPSAWHDLLKKKQEDYAQNGETIGVRLDLNIAAELSSIASDTAPSDDLRANSLNDRAITLKVLGERTSGDAGLTYLKQALAEHEAALALRDREASPEFWAMDQQNRAIVLQLMAERMDGDAGRAHLKESLASYDLALQVFTREKLGMFWAGTQQNRAIVLRILGERTGGEAGTAYLNEALSGYDSALEVYAEQGDEAEWAKVQHNRAIVLNILADWTLGDSGLAFANKALEAYDSALGVITKDTAPIAWARVQQSRAVVLKDLGQRDKNDAGTAYLIDALAALDGALEVLTQENASLNWASVHQTRANVLRALGERAEAEEAQTYFERALESNETVLQVCTKESAARVWADTQHNQALVLRTLGKHLGGSNGVAYLNKAQEGFKAVLEVNSKQHAPTFWASATANIAELHVAKYEILGDMQDLDLAETAARQAMSVYESRAMPNNTDYCQSLLNKISALKSGGSPNAATPD